MPPPSHPAGPPSAGPSPRNLYPSPVEVPQLPLPPPPPPPPSTIPLAEAYQYAYSPDTVASELLTTDMASNRWLDLLATDAAQADAGFSLAPSPAPEDSVSNTGHESQPIGTENQPISGSVSIPAPLANQAAERHAWSLNRDIVLVSANVIFATIITFCWRNAEERSLLHAWSDQASLTPAYSRSMTTNHIERLETDFADPSRPAMKLLYFELSPKGRAYG